MAFTKTIFKYERLNLIQRLQKYFYVVPADTRKSKKLLNITDFVNWCGVRGKKNLSSQLPEELPVYQYASKTSSNYHKQVYIWGFALSGALGNRNFIKPTNGKKPIVMLHKPGYFKFSESHNVTDIACGYGFTVIAVKSKDEKKVFGTGINTDSQIGYHAVRKGHPLEFLLEPVPIALPFQNPTETKILSIGCGRAHSVILTDKEGVFTLGNNSYGQCGRPVVENENYSGSTMIHQFKDVEDFKEVVCGLDHTMFLTNKGEVYSCGWGADGQTGVGNFDITWKCTKLKGDIEKEKIIKLSSAGDCVLAVSDKGDVFGWGNSEYKQLFPATEESQISIPRHLKLPEVGKVVDAAAAGTMCSVVNAKGDVFVWGYGLLGFGPEVDERKVPHQLPSTLFGRNEFSDDVKVLNVTAGLNHFGAITNKDELYMWGKNKWSCLGLGQKQDQYFPMKVSIPAAVRRISCGLDHTSAICRHFV